MGLGDRIRKFLIGDESQRPSFGALDAGSEVNRRGSAGASAAKKRASVVTGIKPTTEYELVASLIQEDSPFTLVMGHAGTGKTTLIHWLHGTVTPNLAILAPTGLAALTAGGQTIHSFFKFPPRPLVESDLERPRDRAVLEKLDLLVIDEVSMVSCELMDGIDAVLRRNRRGRSSDPFGGVQVVAIGDLFQLPPVIADVDQRARIENEYRSEHFFSAKALSSVKPAAVELTKSFRQSDPDYLRLLKEVREAEDPSAAVAEINDRCLELGFEDSEWPVAVPTRNLAHSINQHRMNDCSGSSRTYTGILTGRFLPERVQAGGRKQVVDDRNLPAPFELTLKEGARVIFTKNDPGKRWVNGTMGTVRKLSSDGIAVEADGAHASLLDVSPEKWEKHHFVLDEETGRLVPEVIGSYTQFPLAPAWALTIHKLQGQTVDRLLVDLDRGTFAPGQAYVALSRTRSIEGLKLRRPLDVADIRTDRRILAFMASIRSSLANRVLDAS